MRGASLGCDVCERWTKRDCEGRRGTLRDAMCGTGVAVVGLLALLLAACAGNEADDLAKMQFEAAFQGSFSCV